MGASSDYGGFVCDIHLNGADHITAMAGGEVFQCGSQRIAVNIGQQTATCAKALV